MNGVYFNFNEKHKSKIYHFVRRFEAICSPPPPAFFFYRKINIKKFLILRFIDMLKLLQGCLGLIFTDQFILQPYTCMFNVENVMFD